MNLNIYGKIMNIELLKIYISKLSDEDLVSGLVMIDFSGITIPDELFNRPYGGVILFGKNIRNREQLSTLTKNLREAAKRDILIGVDQEGGNVIRINFDDGVPLCGNMAIGASDSEDLAFKNGHIIGRELWELGFNLNFAPCIDVNSNPLNPIIGTRSFGEDPFKVAKLGKALAKGLETGGVIPCAKHFPGHGDTEFDTHLTMPKSNKTLKELLSCELIPFAELINAEIPMIMTSHICFPSIDDGNLPATLSKKILGGILRQKLNFKGVIVTDSMAMKGVIKRYSYGDAAEKALEAGNDLLLLCGDKKDREKAVDTIIKSVKKGRLDRKSLENSFLKIELMKSNLRSSVNIKNRLSIAEETAKKSIKIVKDENDLIGKKISTVVIAPEKIKKSPHSPPTEISWLPYFMEDETIFFDLETGDLKDPGKEKKLETTERIILNLYAIGKLPEGQKKLAESLRRYEDKIVAVSIGSPYMLLDLPWLKTYVNAFSGNKLSMKHTAAKINGTE